MGDWYGTDLAGFLALYNYEIASTPLASPDAVIPEFIAFGKYKGHTYEEVAKNNPDYLGWMLTGKFKPEQLEAARLALVYDQNQKAQAE